ncbi:MAG TPA: type II secretion system F family protein [bacterium]|nr:type II secretion system F family protein [bacterium]
MPVGAVVAFVVVFVLILFSVSVGLKFFDARRKKQVADMLHTAAGEPVVSTATLLREMEPEKTTGLKHLLSTFQFSRHAQEQIQQAGLTWSSTRLLAAMGLAMVPGLGIGSLLPFLLNGPTTAVVLGVCFALAPYIYVRHRRKKRMDAMEEQFPEALDFLSRSMRAGHAFSISLEMLGEELPDPLGQEFRTLFNEQNLGAPLDIALRNFSTRVPLLDVRFFTSSVLLQKQTGGNLSEILTRLAYVIRERFRLKGQVKAASAHGRLTATILTLLPVGTMLGLLMVAPGYLQSMAEDPDGKWLIGGAIVAQVLGNFFIKKIINIKV